MRSWLPLLAVVAALACLLPLVALNGIPPLLTTAESTRRRPLAPAGLSRQALVETVSSVAQRLELHPLEMDGVSHVLGMLDAVRTTVAAVPEVAKATSSVAASLNGTRNEQAKTSEPGISAPGSRALLRGWLTTCWWKVTTSGSI